LLTRMTGNSLHMQWPLSCMAVSLKENNWFFVTDQTPRQISDGTLLKICGKNVHNFLGAEMEIHKIDSWLQDSHSEWNVICKARAMKNKTR
jgi:hypothetical protein